MEGGLNEILKKFEIISNNFEKIIEDNMKITCQTLILQQKVNVNKMRIA